MEVSSSLSLEEKKSVRKKTPNKDVKQRKKKAFHYS